MKGLRWTLAFLRDPISALGSSIATIRERLAPLGIEIQTRLAETLRNAARKLALVVGAAALALVGAGYVLIGLWPGLQQVPGSGRCVVPSRRVLLASQLSALS